MTNQSHSHEPEVAIAVEHLSKRYAVRPNSLAVPLPRLIPRRLRERMHESATGRPLEQDDDDLDEEDEVVHEGEEAEEEPVRRGRIWALRDVSFVAEAGSGLGVLGPNGSGKTTLLKVLSRITPPTEGRVLLRGRVAPFLGLASSFVQRDQTGRSNVKLLAQLFGVPREVVERRIDEIAEFAELEQHIDVATRRYSSGQLRRLAVSTVLHLEPDILLADEVLAAGDFGFRERCLEYVERGRRQGLTLILASHDLQLVERLCPEAIWMDAGRIVDRGDPGELAARHGYGDRRPAGASGTVPTPSAPHLATSRGWKRSFNEHAAIHSGAIFSADGIPADTVRSDEPSVVKMLLEVASPGITIRGVVTLYRNGTAYIRTFQPVPITVDKPGGYVAAVTLPSGLLREGFHVGRISAIVDSGDGEETIARANVFSFECYDPGDAGEIADEELDTPGLVEFWDHEWRAYGHSGVLFEPRPPHSRAGHA